MTAQFEDEKVVQPVGYDPFPQPQTIPAGWDVSEFFSELEVSTMADDPVETESR
jgi:hypothetical protein